MSLQLEIFESGFPVYSNGRKNWGYFDPKYNRSYIYEGNLYLRFYDGNIFTPPNWKQINVIDSIPKKH